MTERQRSAHRIRIIVVLALGAASLTAQSASADAGNDGSSAGPATIDLLTLLRTAQRNVPAVLAALATLRRVQAEQRLAEGAYLPRVMGTATLGGFYDNRSVLPDSDEQGRIDSVSLAGTATMTVDWGALDLARKHDVATAHANSRVQASGVQASQRLALLAAAELYLRALSASALVEDASINLTRRSQQQESIEELTRAGLRPPVDATRASVETVAAKYVLEMRTVDEQASFAALAAAVGESPERGLRPLPIEGDLFAGPRGIDEASQLARSQRPEVKRLRERVEAQQAALRATRAGRFPTLGLFANGQASYYEVLAGEGIQGNQNSVNGGLYLRWNGGDAQVVRRQQVALAQVGEAQRELENVELAVRAEVVDAGYAVRRAQAQVEQSTQMLEAARATRSAQQERYGAGAASLLELLDAEALEQSARRARIEATRDYDLARARLLAACGTLNQLLGT